MSGDPSHGFGQYSAPGPTPSWNWAQMLANSTAPSPMALQAAVAAQRVGFHQHHHPNPAYPPAGPNVNVATSPWAQQWGSWAQPSPQTNRVPSFSVQPHVAALQQQQQQHHPGLAPPSTQNSFKCRLVAVYIRVCRRRSLVCFICCYLSRYHG